MKRGGGGKTGHSVCLGYQALFIVVAMLNIVEAVAEEMTIIFMELWKAVGNNVIIGLEDIYNNSLVIERGIIVRRILYHIS